MAINLANRVFSYLFIIINNILLNNINFINLDFNIINLNFFAYIIIN